MLPIAQERPCFGPIVAGRDGSLWIGSPRNPGFDAFEGAIEGLEPANEWIVVHLEEGTAGRAITPEGFRLTDAGEGFVIGIHRDALGRESVRRYPMERVQGTRAGSGPPAGGGPPAGSGEEGIAAAPSACRPLPEALRRTLEAGRLPEGWRITEAVIVLAENLTRASDGAPSEVVVAQVLDDEGEPFPEGPVEWVIEGGTAPTRAASPPRGVLLLNPASHAMLERVAEERPVLRMPDATSPSVGWTLDHPAVVLARECLGSVR